MHEGLELLKHDISTQQLGVLLAVCCRAQGGDVMQIIENLRASAGEGSSLARNTLASYQQADEALQRLAADDRAKRLHSGPHQHGA